LSRLTQTRAHQKAQYDLKTLFPNGQLEVTFSAISRRADFYLPSFQLVIEIQLSPISKEEIVARVEDYKRIGLSVIWLINSGFERKNQHLVFEKSKAQYYFFNSLRCPILIYDRLYVRFFSILRPKILDIKNLILIKTDMIPRELPFSLQKRVAYSYRVDGDYLSSALISPALMEFIRSKDQKKSIFFKTLRLFYVARFKSLLKRCSS
jgi:hypothetical protein